MSTYKKHCSHEGIEDIWARKPSTIGTIQEAVSLPDGPPVIMEGEPKGMDTRAIRLPTVEDGLGNSHPNCQQLC